MGYSNEKKTRDEVREELRKLNEEAPCFGYVINWRGKYDSGQLLHETVWSDGSSGGCEILCDGNRLDLFRHVQAMRDGVRAVKSTARSIAGLDLRSKDPSRWGPEGAPRVVVKTMRRIPSGVAGTRPIMVRNL